MAPRGQIGQRRSRGQVVYQVAVDVQQRHPIIQIGSAVRGPNLLE
jgi:hypothetical protein